MINFGLDSLIETIQKLNQIRPLILLKELY